MNATDNQGQTWVLATGNPGKLKEFNQRFAALDIGFRPQSDFDLHGVEETGTTFVENAILKAKAACQASSMPALADDSGLRVPSLGGAPGVYSARYAGPDATDAQNNQKLLEALEGSDDRCAEFCCALVLMRSAEDPMPLIVQATWSGTIARQSSGEGGFGYDPLFVVDGGTTTSAELAAAEKNLISHRGQAIDGLLAALNNHGVA
ncbi:MAG: RdgB/HAM1 family non-canonical purine NTP pyrophosphatase [Lysobacterales bacterium]